MPASHQPDLDLALEMAALADEISMARYRAGDLHVEAKPDRTLVTEADRAVEQALRERLSVARPDDAVVGEEMGEKAGASAARRWIIDPIDGTNSYLRGMPTWATLIALEVEGQSAVGVASMPALGHRWWAARGAGAFCDGTPIRASGVAELAAAQLCWSGVESWDEVGRLDALIELARACWRTRGIGDAWQYMLVAEGAADIAVDPSVSLWDMAAVKIIVEEAGGAFTDLHGVITASGGSGLATNGLLHQAALEYIGIPTASS